MSGPLAALRVLEVASIGPGPFAGMFLADLGAEVLRVERPGTSAAAIPNVDQLLGRGRRSVALDLKTPQAVALFLELVERADVLIEGFRPGTTERLGIGPAVCTEHNPRLVYGRITGWGQEGPLADSAGHDINYIALSGALASIGRSGAPVPPLNLVGDFGGGGMLLVAGILAALVERATSGIGQVVDAAMVDGAALLMTMLFELRNAGLWDTTRESNLLDGGAPFYDVYRTADDRFIAVGALEPQFFRELTSVLGIAVEAGAQHDRSAWPHLRAQLEAAIRQRTRDQWEEAFRGHDACVTPVLTMDEAPAHPHNRVRETFTAGARGWEPSPAPRFQRTPVQPATAERSGADAAAILADWGIAGDRLNELTETGVIRSL